MSGRGGGRGEHLLLELLPQALTQQRQARLLGHEIRSRLLVILLPPPPTHHHTTTSRGGDSPATPSDSAVLHGAVAEGVSGELRYHVQSGTLRTALACPGDKTGLAVLALLEFLGLEHEIAKPDHVHVLHILRHHV